jgi:hypothetical protein
MRISAPPQALRAFRVTAATLLAAGLLGGTAGCGGQPPARPAAPAERAEPTPAATAGRPRGDRSGATSARASAPVAWTIAAVVTRLTGERIRVAGTTVPIDPATLTCGGEGPEGRRGATPAWTRFRCVQPTFPRGEVAGPDAVFLVEPTGPRTFVVRGARLTTY